MTLQILGLCRFSYLGFGGFKIEHATLDDRRAFLYEPDRLNLRMIWFEHVWLPSIIGQTDPDFRIIILTGLDLPTAALSRLHDLVAPHPQLRVVQQEPDRHRVVCSHVIRQEIDANASVVAQFRLDDDDAVAVDFIARTRSDFREMIEPIMPQVGTIALDYCRGLTLDVQQGILEVLPHVAPLHPAGLVVFVPPQHPLTVMNYTHNKMATFMPVLSLSDSVMFVRGRHVTNGSGDAAQIGYAFNLEADEETVLRGRFAIDLPRFRQAVAEVKEPTPPQRPPRRRRQ